MAIRSAIRRLRAGERDKIRDHLLRLDGDDRQLRFGGCPSDAHIVDYCERLDWSRSLVVGYVTDGEVRGVGQLEPIGDARPRAAELAVSVERAFQNRGLGTTLLRRLVIAARNRLIEQIYMVCLMDNGRAISMVRRLDRALQFCNGEAEARIKLPWPTPWTWLEELRFEVALIGVDHTLSEPLAGAQASQRTPAGRPGATMCLIR